VLVARVLENSPAQKGGIKDSDIIKQFDNKSINNVRDLLSTVGKTEVGRRVKVVVIRDKKELTLEVEIGERPQDLEKIGIEAAGTWRGLEVEDLTPENIKRFSIEEKKGVVVVDVEGDSPADEAGIVRGDIILEINKQSVKNISEYQKLTKGIKGDCLVKTARGYFLIKESGK
jgi:serine protease Do